MVKKHNESMDLAVGPTLIYGKTSVLSDISATDLGVPPASYDLRKICVCLYSLICCHHDCLWVDKKIVTKRQKKEKQ